MMFCQRVLWMFAGLVLCSNTSIGIAADAKTFDLRGWKITVTPGDFPSAELPRLVMRANEGLPSSSVDIPQAVRQRSRTVARQVSLEQDAALVPAAPVPIDVTLPHEPMPDSTPSVPVEVGYPARVMTASGDCGLPVMTPKASDAFPTGSATVPPQTAMYREVYDSIPFSRAEYNANPSYRHDATMEFLFNQLRPTVIHRTTNINDHIDDGYGWYPQQPYYPYSYGLRIHRSR